MMIIYELSVDDLNASRLFFPIEGQEEKILELEEERITNGVTEKDQWEDFLKDPYFKERRSSFLKPFKIK